MKTITQGDLQGEYWAGRWSYVSIVLEWLGAYEHGTRVLEIGCADLQFVLGGDTLDRKDFGLPLTYRHDLRNVPWPIPDKHYDLAIATQVWEHLDGNQVVAFDELERVTHEAILSIPYRWKDTPVESHNGLDESTMLAWSGGRQPIQSAISTDGRRYIARWEL